MPRDVDVNFLLHWSLSDGNLSACNYYKVVLISELPFAKQWKFPK